MGHDCSAGARTLFLGSLYVIDIVCNLKSGFMKDEERVDQGVECIDPDQETIAHLGDGKPHSS